MVVRFAYDFNDQQLEEIAKAIDGDKKRRKGAKPRKASRKECLGLIEGALKRALVEAFAASERLPAADLNKLARGESLAKRGTPSDSEPFASAGTSRDYEKLEEQARQLVEKLDPKERKAREAENLERMHRGIVSIEKQRALGGTTDDPICLRESCGAPKSKHSKFRQCPGKRGSQIGVFEAD
jgi:hypothetical protein